MISTTQLRLPDADAARLIEALRFALDLWNGGQLVAGAGATCSIALDVRRLLSLLTTTESTAGVKVVTLSGDMVGALHQVARGCESGGGAPRALAPLVRRVADQLSELAAGARLTEAR